jgi:4-amino-4-deoxy-L-arabinose transferase-like glycosyltransferase
LDKLRAFRRTCSLRPDLLAGILLVAALMRWTALAQMRQMLDYDEAYYGFDALSLLYAPRLTSFFATNFGRESAWMYILAPFLAWFGANPFAMHLAAAFIGVLTVAATYRLAREVLNVQGATWAMAAFAVFYWPVHHSHLALRGTPCRLAAHWR